MYTPDTMVIARDHAEVNGVAYTVWLAERSVSVVHADATGTSQKRQFTLGDGPIAKRKLPFLACTRCIGVYHRHTAFC